PCRLIYNTQTAYLFAWVNRSKPHIGPGLTHFMTNHLIELRGEDALVTVHNHFLNVGMGGVYHCRAVPTPQGWRIAELRFEVRYFGDVIERLNGYMSAVDGRGV